MRTITNTGRWLMLLLVLCCITMTAQAQRTVTLTLNTSTVPDTLRTDSFIEVRGAVNGVAPITLFDGNIIDWSDASTLEPVNIGGDYWQLQFQIADTTDLTFKYYSGQLNEVADGWEVDPNPTIEAGAADTTLPVHFFEFNGTWRGLSGDKGPHDWRPYEPMEDLVAVNFRVYMDTPEGSADGYDATNDAQIIGVRGDDLSGMGPLDWGSTDVVLEQESTDSGVAGYDLYSAVAYYPAEIAGMEQNYKFVVTEGETTEFEEGDVTGNRTFTVPAQDTTLQWVYYGNQAPVSVDPVEALVIFAVDLSPLETIGVFDRARGDTLEVRGGFNGWDCSGDGAPDDCLLQRVPGEDQFEAAIPLTRIPGQNIAYKFFLNLNDEAFEDEFGVEPPSGWEEGHRTGINRTYSFTSDPVQDLGVLFFNDIQPENIIPNEETIELMYSVDLSSATDASLARPFDPASGDSVFIEVGDPIWAFTQDIVVGPNDPGEFPYLRGVLTDDDGDLIYTGNFTVQGPTYSNLTYKYAYGQGSDIFVEPGGDTANAGRRRTNYIVPNPDGTWPAAYSLPEATFQVAAGPLPFDENPALSTGVEVVNAEVPTRIKLEANYPNPFRSTTTFRYAIPQTQRVTVRVYDVLGRAVATLVDKVQPAATYEVSFDATELASGLYLYQVQAGDTVVSKTMMLVK